MSEYNVVDNTELVELIERGLRKGYWDKALIPELKKRFKEMEKQEKLLKLYKELMTVKDELISLAYFDNAYYLIRKPETNLEKQIKELEQQIKELENSQLFIKRTILQQMTSKEALKCLEPFRWDDKKEIKAYEVLEELVERDTPKKIEYDDFEEPCCPDCGEVQCTNVYATNNCFCPYCGQRLDWSDWSE